MILVKQLSGISIETIHETFKKSFADYVEPFDLTINQLQYMIERRGFNLDLSFGAFHNKDLVAITLNGVGNWNGNLTAYDTGTGVTKEFRKRGIATKMFTESLPILRNNNISHYLLEVICSNSAAFKLYKKAGFKVTREFDYYISKIDQIKFPKNIENKGIRIEILKNPNWDLFKTFWDFDPSWQNSIDSINRKFFNFKILGIYVNDKLAGYGIIEQTTGDIPQLGVAKSYRRRGLATKLLKNLINYSDVDVIKIINSDAAYEPFKKFTNKINLHPGIGQYEMILEL